MKRITAIFSAMMFIAFIYVGASSFADEMKEPAGATHSEATFGIGKEVKNMEGEDLGTVKDFVTDSEGRIAFAIVSTGGFMGIGEKEVAVPYSALTYDKEAQHFACSISKDQLASAPKFENEDQLKNRSFAEDVYRHFGARPYWTEEPKGKKPMGNESSPGREDRKGPEKSY